MPNQRNVRTRQYHELLAKLPQHVQDLAEVAFQFFLKDQSHPSLRHHLLKDTRAGQHRQSSYSVSVSARYRAIYVVDGETNVWYWIGSHEDYNHFTGG